VADISAIIDVMAGIMENDKADVNGDGQVNVADISNVIDIMAGN
jgi:nitrogen regulatory protein PII